MCLNLSPLRAKRGNLGVCYQARLPRFARKGDKSRDRVSFHHLMTQLFSRAMQAPLTRGLRRACAMICPCWGSPLKSDRIHE